ncbi:MAG TPA: MarC family protein [Candidatus Binatia bacterium]|nr:MarC family protein [Candidatus Binatia bacterium]
MPAADLAHFALTSFVTLLVVIDPFGAVPIITSLLEGLSVEERRGTLRRAVGFAFGIALFFLVAGRALLGHLGVSVHAFGISGGILLFAVAMPMLFGHRPGLQAPEAQEQPGRGEDLAIFPLAIPLLSGPGTIATVLLLTADADGDLWRLLIIASNVAVIFAITFAVLVVGERFLHRVGTGKAHMMTRVMGIVLAALAVQYVLDGVAGYYRSLV